jgi:hypothetical protein
MTTRSIDALQRRNRKCLDTQDPAAALTTEALAEAAAVLDESIGAAAFADNAVNTEGLFEVACLHMVRELALAGHPDQQRESAAQTALWVLIAIAGPDRLPPHVHQSARAAIERGAATDPPTAATMALWCHATAVRAAWRREQAKTLGFADLLVRAFERAAEVGGPSVAEHSTRLITLAGCHELRMQFRPDGDPGIVADLHTAVDLVEQGLAAEPVKPDMRLRGLRLQAQTALMYGRLAGDVAWFNTAAAALRSAIDLADINDPGRSGDYELLQAILIELRRP